MMLSENELIQPEVEAYKLVLITRAPMSRTGRASGATGYSPQETAGFVCCGVGGEEESLKDATNALIDAKETCMQGG
jgi:hypothetical protein